MKGINAHSEAKREVAMEKARMLGKRTNQPSVLEQSAIEWEREKEETAGKRENEEESRPLWEESPAASLQNMAPSISVKRTAESVGWVQYNPWKKPGGKKETKSVNAATLNCFAKSIMAKEWRKARGIKRRDPRIDAMEREAALWKVKKEEEKKRIEKETEEIRRQREKLKRALQGFGDKLFEMKEKATPDLAEEVFKNAMERIGEVIQVNWTGDGVDTYIEPWEEKRLRRQRGETLPTVYRLRIDDKLQLISYELVEDEEIRIQNQNKMIAKPLKSVLGQKESGNAKVILMKKLGEIGRIIELSKTDAGWLAEVEPWEEVRSRNINRGGKPPITTFNLHVKKVNGRLDILSCEKLVDGQRLKESNEGILSTNKIVPEIIERR